MDMVEFAESTWTHWELLPGCRDNWAADYIEIMTIGFALWQGVVMLVMMAAAAPKMMGWMLKRQGAVLRAHNTLHSSDSIVLPGILMSAAIGLVLYAHATIEEV